jgi:hypothetical protein
MHTAAMATYKASTAPSRSRGCSHDGVGIAPATNRKTDDPSSERIIETLLGIISSMTYIIASRADCCVKIGVFVFMVASKGEKKNGYTHRCVHLKTKNPSYEGLVPDYVGAILCQRPIAVAQ